MDGEDEDVCMETAIVKSSDSKKLLATYGRPTLKGREQSIEKSYRTTLHSCHVNSTWATSKFSRLRILSNG